VKKAEIRTLLQNIDKETAATITFDEFLEMATPKIQNRDEREEIMKVRLAMQNEGPSCQSCTVFRSLARRVYVWRRGLTFRRFGDHTPGVRPFR
jgi:hypothetical protein